MGQRTPGEKKKTNRNFTRLQKSLISFGFGKVYGCIRLAKSVSVNSLSKSSVSGCSVDEFFGIGFCTANCGMELIS